MIYHPAMNFGLNKKVISFIGLFFLVSISLHSFAHIDESPLELNDQSECLSWHNEVSPDIDIVFNTSKKTYVPIADVGSLKPLIFNSISLLIHKRHRKLKFKSFF